MKERERERQQLRQDCSDLCLKVAKNLRRGQFKTGFEKMYNSYIIDHITAATVASAVVVAVTAAAITNVSTLSYRIYLLYIIYNDVYIHESHEPHIKTTNDRTNEQTNRKTNRKKKGTHHIEFFHKRERARVCV